MSGRVDFDSVQVIDVSRKDGILTCTLDDGRALACERLLFAGGRAGNTRGLGLERVGVQPDARGLLKVDDRYQVPGTKDGRIFVLHFGPELVESL